jgi:hypothetical protein
MREETQHQRRHTGRQVLVWHVAQPHPLAKSTLVYGLKRISLRYDINRRVPRTFRRVTARPVSAARYFASDIAPVKADTLGPA